MSLPEYRAGHVDGFRTIFHHRNWRAKRSCDTISKQQGDVANALQLHSAKMLWNPSIHVQLLDWTGLT